MTLDFIEVSSTAPYARVVLIEPVMVSREVYNAHKEERQKHVGYIMKVLRALPSFWNSREAAYDFVSRRPPWCSWTERARRAYIVREVSFI